MTKKSLFLAQIALFVFFIGCQGGGGGVANLGGQNGVQNAQNSYALQIPQGSTHQLGTGAKPCKIVVNLPALPMHLAKLNLCYALKYLAYNGNGVQFVTQYFSANAQSATIYVHPHYAQAVLAFVVPATAPLATGTNACTDGAGTGGATGTNADNFDAYFLPASSLYPLEINANGTLNLNFANSVANLIYYELLTQNTLCANLAERIDYLAHFNWQKLEEDIQKKQNPYLVQKDAIKKAIATGSMQASYIKEEKSTLYAILPCNSSARQTNYSANAPLPRYLFYKDVLIEPFDVFAGGNLRLVNDDGEIFYSDKGFVHVQVVSTQQNASSQKNSLVITALAR